MTAWSGRSVLVTGATGMVGSWLTRRLVDEGTRVTVLIRDDDPQSELLRSGTLTRCSVVSGRLEDQHSVERAVVEQEVDVVFHLGAQTIVGAATRDPRSTFESNIAGTWSVLEAARRHPDLVRAVVVATSDKAYGESAELPYREDMPLVGTGPYEVSKSCADLLARSYGVFYGVPAAIVRCGNIFGGGDLNWSRIVPGTMAALHEGRQPVLRSDGTFLRDYLYVDDAVDAYLSVAAAVLSGLPGGEAFNISMEDPRSVLDIYTAVCEVVAGEFVQPQILGGAKDEIKDQYLSARKAAEVLGWHGRHTLRSGLELTWEWYRAFFASRGVVPTPGTG